MTRELAVSISCLALALAVACPVCAEPPPVGSEDYKIMHPYADWVTAQHDAAGRWCCSPADGRPVEARTRTSIDPDGVEREHREAHITPEHFPGETDRWVTVPDAIVLHTENPVGAPILWLYHGAPRCFAPASGV